MNATGLFAIANTLTWPGAFAIVGCAVAGAVCIVAMCWAFRGI